MLEARRSRVQFPMRPSEFLIDGTMAVGPTRPLTEMSTRSLPGDKGLPARKADLTAQNYWVF
jgi:hypothetical protein